MEPLNNGHVGDEHFVPSFEIEMYGQLMAGGKQFDHCREVVLLSECPSSEVLLYMYTVLEAQFTHYTIHTGFLICNVYNNIILIV